MLRNDVRYLRGQVRRIQPRNTTAISLVATDGGNVKLAFDPYLIQLVRVVDSSNNEYCLEVVTPTTDIIELGQRQFNSDGSPVGEMMAYLNVKTLPELSHMIRITNHNKPVSPTWIQVYRELVEWAILFTIVRHKDFATDTLIVFDGLLRSKVFSKDLFAKYKQGLNDAIERNKKKNRNIYIVGLAKRSKVLDRYRLALAFENILRCNYPAYVKVPRELEERVYIWSEYARGDDRELGNITEINKFVAGSMYFVKFGNRSTDPIWPVDIFTSQTSVDQIILGHLLADAINGFPIPFYPLCLQKAHEAASLGGLDFEMLQDLVFDGIRETLKAEAQVIDVFRLQDNDVAKKRY